MTLSELLIPEYDQEMANTRKTLEQIPDGKMDYKPHERSMPLGRLAGHVAEMAGWAKTTLELDHLELDPSWKPADPKSRQEVLDMFDQNVATTRELLAGASDEHLQKTWTLGMGGKTMMSMTRYQVMRGMILNHMIHHRAQLGVYLRLNNIAVPGVYGPSADEPNTWAQNASA